MIPRLLVGALLLVAAWWTRRHGRALLSALAQALRAPVAAVPLESDELAELHDMAARCEPVREALRLRGEMDALPAPDDNQLAGRIDEVLRQLGRATSVRSRITELLGGIDEGHVELDLMEARGRLRGATDGAARGRAAQDLRGLGDQQALLDRLHVRRSELERASRQAIVELTDVHRILRDAGERKEVLAGERLAALHEALGRASGNLSGRHTTDVEVRDLLRGRDEIDT